MLGSFPPELLVVFTATSLLRSEEPTLSCNQFSTFDRSIAGEPVTRRKSQKPRISRSVRALAIWRQASILATCEFGGPLPRNFRIVVGSLEHSDLTLAATHGIRSAGRSNSRSDRLMSRCCQDTLNAARR